MQRCCHAFGKSAAWPQLHANPTVFSLPLFLMLSSLCYSHATCVVLSQLPCARKPPARSRPRGGAPLVAPPPAADYVTLDGRERPEIERPQARNVRRDVGAVRGQLAHGVAMERELGEARQRRELAHFSKGADRVAVEVEHLQPCARDRRMQCVSCRS